MRARAIQSHEIPKRPPLTITPGDVVTVSDRTSEWPAFVFVAADGGEGWVPERYLSTRRPRAVVEQSYDTTELPVTRGEVVTVAERDDESGWWWCQSESGSRGWVPVEVLEIIDD